MAAWPYVHSCGYGAVSETAVSRDWPAPAKLNLFLRICGRRADGYHELQTVFRLLDWGDEVRLRVREDGAIRRLTAVHGDGPDLVVVEEGRVGMAEPALDDVAQHHLAEREAVRLQALGFVAKERFESEEPVQHGDQVVTGQAGPLHPAHRESGLLLDVAALRYRDRHDRVAEQFLRVFPGQCQLVGLVSAPVPPVQPVVEGVADSDAEAPLEVLHMR